MSFTSSHGGGPVITYNGISGGSITYSTTSVYDTDDFSIKQEIPQKKHKDDKTTPKVFFRFVKSNLTKLEITKIHKRILLLKKELEQSELIGQQGLTETCMKALVLAAKELKITSVLCQPIQKISRKVIEKYMHRVVEDKTDPNTRQNKILFLKPLENFPRSIPIEVVRRIKDAKRANLFDGYVVLYLDYTKQQEVKTTKDKIREKDPILFGFFKEDPDALYFIADWVDEVCDLTFEQILDDMIQELPEEVTPAQVKDIIKESYIKKLMTTIEGNEKALSTTNIHNWKQRVQEYESFEKIKQNVVLFKQACKDRWAKIKTYLKMWG